MHTCLHDIVARVPGSGSGHEACNCNRVQSPLKFDTTNTTVGSPARCRGVRPSLFFMRTAVLLPWPDRSSSTTSTWPCVCVQHSQRLYEQVHGRLGIIETHGRHGTVQRGHRANGFGCTCSAANARGVFPAVSTASWAALKRRSSLTACKSPAWAATCRGVRSCGCNVQRVSHGSQTLIGCCKGTVPGGSLHSLPSHRSPVSYAVLQCHPDA
jgi:hypothetical protein